MQRLLPVLSGLTPEQVAIASNIGGKQALETVQRPVPGLTRSRWWPSPATMAASRRWRRCSGCCRCMPGLTPGGGHRQQWRQAGAGDGAAAVAGAARPMA
ncbi:hypothetical protein [Xanthomonas citri]|uniref:hypothetical protein n=1 Tax=Xanthomonas citri TaxID=346 RepID=UPI003CCFD6CF